MAYTTIDDPGLFFNALLYTGNGSTNALTGVGFQPDWVWLKGRSNGDGSRLYDAVRGTTKEIFTDATDGENTNSNGLTAFGTDGFTLGSSSGTNGSSRTYVGWNWKAGGGQGSSNTDGSINTTYTSVNTTAGFSIVKWTGSNANATIGHGLGAVPKMIIVKNLATATSWMVYHVTQGATKFLRLNQTNAVATGSTPFNDTTPTSSVFSVGANGDTNGSSQATIAYCFAEKKGYSKFGSYTGNGNADGQFCFTGFRPSFILGKRTDSAGGWWLSDNKRSSGFNLNDEYLIADSSNAEQDDGSFASDFLSNGWKARATNGNFNASGGSYIYMAFAESPFVNSNGVPTNAR